MSTDTVTRFVRQLEARRIVRNPDTDVTVGWVEQMPSGAYRAYNKRARLGIGPFDTEGEAEEWVFDAGV